MRAVAQDLFASLNPEEEQERQEFKLEKNPRLEALLNAWNALGDERTIFTYSEEQYEFFCKKIPQDYNPADVYLFAKHVWPVHNKEMLTSSLCQFLNALINQGEHDTYCVPIHEMQRIIGLGYLNTKNILVTGTTGWVQGVGQMMSSGSIEVKGEGTLNGSSMTGGKLILHGSQHVGSKMTGGEIIVHGDAMYYGNKGRGGECTIHGTANDPVRFLRGNIYHKGKLIMNVGEML